MSKVKKEGKKGFYSGCNADCYSEKCERHVMPGR